MPKRNPVLLTPASIVTYVLDAQTRKKFNEREHYRMNPDRYAKIKINYAKNKDVYLTTQKQKNYYQQNKETIKQKQKEYREKNKETIKQNKNKESIKAYSKAYYEKNKELVLQNQKEYYQKNKEHLDKINKEWKKNNKDIIKASNKKYREKLKQKNGVCGCGSVAIDMSRHLKSKKHLDWVNVTDTICQVD